MFQFPHSNHPHAKSTMYLQVHDVCSGRGKYFVVTNYIRWAFGKLELPNAMEAFITDSFEAPILEFDGTYPAVPSIGFTAIEALAFWIHYALAQSQSGAI
jgi:hypothetical protein